MINRQQLAYDLFVRPALDEAAARHNRPALNSPLALRYVVAAMVQESDMLEVVQRPTGPGRGMAQFEGGETQALGGLLKLPQVAWVRTSITELGWPLDREILHWACMVDQRVSALLARALYWSDPAPLQDDEQIAYAIFTRCWRPGKPRPQDWPRSWRMAGEIVSAAPAEPAPAIPEVPDHPSRWPLSARRWVVRRQRHNVSGTEYWTGAHVGPQRECNPVVALDPSKAERWIDEQAALAAVRAYDDRMIGQGFVAWRLKAA